MNGLILPYAYGLGDIIRHEPLIRGIKEKYPEIKLSMYNARDGLLKNIPSLSFSNILSYRFDLIVNLQEVHDFKFLHEKKYLWKELLGVTNEYKATNQAVYDDFRSYKDFCQPFDVLYKLREKVNKNLATWLCEICDIFPTDKRIHYYLSEEEIKFSEKYTEGFILLHPKACGIMGPSFVDSVEKRNWDILKFKDFVSQNPQFQFIAIGSKEDYPVIKDLEGPNCTLSIDSLRNNLALLTKAKYFIGLDSGPSHVAFALDVPSLVLYCGIFKHACTPIEPRVKHIMYHKDLDTIKNITVKEVQEQFEYLQKLNN